MELNVTCKKEKQSRLQSCMGVIERVGNKLPSPALLFVYISVAVLILSAILGTFNVVAETELGKFPINNLLGQKPIEVLKVTAAGTAVSETYSNGLSYIIGSVIQNFMGMTALGAILIIMLSIGVMEQSGYLSIGIQSIVKATPAKLVTPVVIFLGVMSNVASDAGYVVLIPLAALVYYTIGRNPMVGLAAGFAGVSGGFSANLLIGSFDALLIPFTQAAAETGDALVGTSFAPMLKSTSNMFFLMASTFIIVAIGTFIIDKIVEPGMEKYDKSEADVIEKSGDLTDQEKKAFKAANFSLLGVIAFIVLTVLPFDKNNVIPIVGDLSTSVSLTSISPEGTMALKGVNSFLDSIFFSGDMIMMLMFIVFLVPGLVYGFKSGTFKTKDDVIGAMVTSMKSMASIIVILFFVAQFLNFFNDSHLGILIASLGAKLVAQIPTDNTFMAMMLMIAFIWFTAIINLFIAGGTSKYGLLAPIFIPILMSAGFSPAGVQLMYRIGDSSTNIISPLMSYMGVIVIFGQKYKKNFGIGNLMGMMLPISIGFLLAWTVFAVAWALVGAPIGPGEFFFINQY
ncbi:aminobenzoyl-glutamate transporter [Paraclostridium bifermentans]|uniref:AbgT family transporter n=2 Tax=Paraclostridium bifermentans TaxID=1490 RepID=UPI0021C38501|nr:AbgT family transporter [Paraclostridium bifermentans]MDV8110504.1 AbgT family transporter [Bacillus sp. BAU-SS-2023]GKZ03248.1 aminobenzoyl-glutamate transporter [Paraclostridium bifermentans]GKZ06339.1 aminobenzoyl-glutamate transporter [Paraclostridium bifermentans]GKZ11138.1 aminobenzoyl-glutamate transporter [Paraclostridium bifermentans]